MLRYRDWFMRYRVVRVTCRGLGQTGMLIALRVRHSGKVGGVTLKMVENCLEHLRSAKMDLRRVQISRL